MEAGDEVVSVGGHAVSSWSDMRTEVQFAAGRETEFKVRRGEDILTLAITPETVDGVAMIMAVSETNANAACAMWMPHRNPFLQVAWDAGAVFRALEGLVTPREMKATGKAVGGPVMIAKGTYATIRRDTWDGIGFLRFINTNLAVMNLLPIPVLDGGLILFSLIAMIMRRRIPEKIVAPVTMFFMYLLMALMAFLVIRDFWIIGKRAAKDSEAVRQSQETQREEAPPDGD
jgi:regulator of sigma E protease